MIWSPKFIAVLFAAGQTLVLASQKVDNAGQAVLDDQQSWTPSRSQKVAPTLTAKIEGSASATYAAEVAELHIEVSAQNETESAAFESWTVAAQHVSDYLQSRPSVVKFDRTSSRVIAGDSRRFKSKDNDESTGPTVMNRFIGSVESPEMVEVLTRELQSIANVRVQWIDWSLSDETKAMAKVSVKTAAIKDCFDVGQGYSDMLGTGYSTMELAEIDEQHSWFEARQKHRSRYYFGDEEDGLEMTRTFVDEGRVPESGDGRGWAADSDSGETVVLKKWFDASAVL
ncbi:hypothetical protein LTR10_012259 [Elasticomyces elasticus]|nr:hypothetical protein LTR10_012259 [Elasticomyces elasticus]KAK4965737.1 hypothetical protein LTR42_011750 [Elasticomyces elasticus]